MQPVPRLARLIELEARVARGDFRDRVVTINDDFELIDPAPGYYVLAEVEELFDGSETIGYGCFYEGFIDEDGRMDFSREDDHETAYNGTILVKQAC
jgi:hypothetical protein